jgi:ADP-L-glycero-D-manno-heptose 6-epimerase
MNIVVTGHLGFIGRNLKAELEKKHQVYGIEVDAYDDADWQFTLKNKLDSIKPTAIFHVGAISNTLHTDVETIMKLNWETTTVFSDYCKAVNIPLIYSSTAAIYGDGEGKKNLYAWTKYAGEKYVIANNQIALRYFNVYGPGEDKKKRMASVAYQAFLHDIHGTKIKLFKGEPKRDFVYVKDVVDANIFALKNYFKLTKKQYDVGVGKAVTFEYLMDIMNLKYAYQDISAIPNNYQYHTQSNPENWMKGWKPKYDVEKGLNEYKQHLWNTI